jgi:hypothetical protein
MQLKIYLQDISFRVKEGFAEGSVSLRGQAAPHQGSSATIAAVRNRSGRQQQTTGPSPMAIAFLRAVFPVIDRLPPVKRVRARGLARREGATPQTPRLAGAAGQGVIACRARVITSLGVA